MTPKSLINLKINCKVSGLVDSECVKYATACVSVHLDMEFFIYARDESAPTNEGEKMC